MISASFTNHLARGHGSAYWFSSCHMYFLKCKLYYFDCDFPEDFPKGPVDNIRPLFEAVAWHWMLFKRNGLNPRILQCKTFFVIGSTSIARRFYKLGYFGWLFHFEHKKESIIMITENVSAWKFRLHLKQRLYWPIYYPWLVDPLRKGQVMQEAYPCHGVIM